MQSAVDFLADMRKMPAAQACWLELTPIEKGLMAMRFFECCGKIECIRLHHDLIRCGRRYVCFSMDLGAAVILFAVSPEFTKLAMLDLSVDRQQLATELQPSGLLS